jgi:hypothetical protein
MLEHLQSSILVQVKRRGVIKTYVQTFLSDIRCQAKQPNDLVDIKARIENPMPEEEAQKIWGRALLYGVVRLEHRITVIA